jgi:8-oxo-dGTP pyrophosphatase MutT (NUDIX family)
MLSPLLRSLRQVQLVYWRFTWPLSVGVKAMILDEAGRVLLVRHTYRDGWFFPGGGVKRRETLVDAVKRELFEEVGVTLLAEPILVSAYSNFAEYKSDHVVFFKSDQYSIKPNPNIEIAEHRFFDVRQLPDSVSPATVRRIKEHLGETPIGHMW